MQAIDETPGDDGGHVELTDGGVNHRFLEVRLNSQIGGPLEYMIIAFTKRDHESNNSSLHNNWLLIIIIDYKKLLLKSESITHFFHYPEWSSDKIVWPCNANFYRHIYGVPCSQLYQLL